MFFFVGLNYAKDLKLLVGELYDFLFFRGSVYNWFSLSLRLRRWLLLLLRWRLLTRSSFDLSNLSLDQLYSFLQALSVLTGGSKWFGSIHHEVLGVLEECLEVGRVRLWCRHASLNIRLNRLLAELQRLFTELKEGVVIWTIPVLLHQKAKVVSFVLDDGHGNHWVGVVVFLFLLDGVVYIRASCYLLLKLFGFIWSLDRFGYVGDYLFWGCSCGLGFWVHQEMLLKLTLKLLFIFDMHKSRLCIARFLRPECKLSLLSHLSLELLSFDSRVNGFDTQLSVKCRQHGCLIVHPMIATLWTQITAT